MSRHVPRRERWQRRGPGEYRSADGLTVRYEKRAWWAEVAYTLLLPAPSPEGLPAAEPHHDRLGPFRRPRNAMVEAERHATLLRNRHGERVRFG
ncbi:MAG TPA: hypothetical protein VIL46_04800 [Gemmataceae bacterium]